jgi:hypothetical protein
MQPGPFKGLMYTLLMVLPLWAIIFVAGWWVLF